ncbi:MAG: hypothetical protein P4L91_15720 [Burkholderiaceae bacterium]|nr:hypothetical protein [Burkholderiaceae bacterium]
MASTEPASFINLDLELESHSNLSALAQHLAGQVFVLFNGETAQGFRLVMEPLIDSALNGNPLACTEHFIALLNSLPKELLDIWKNCTFRVFDYGFEGGIECPPLHTTICTASLLQIANLGADIRITVYPFREEEPCTK